MHSRSTSRLVSSEINERACHEEELRIKEQNAKERRNEVKRLNEIEFQKHESMMHVGTILNDNLNVTKQQGKNSSPGKDTDAEGAKMSKNDSDYDIIIAKSSHDKTKLSDLDETPKQNELLKDRLLEATLAEDVKNLVTTSCVEIRENNCENEKCELQTKIVKLENVLTQKTKYFDDVKLELSNRTTKFEAYFEKLENTKVVLERQLSRKVEDSKAEKDQILKEINHLSTQLENLKGKSVETKFDKPSILGKPLADKLLITSQH
ncbi:hypothetical protein Tco_1555044 [Tanacetum coccineum]